MPENQPIELDKTVTPEAIHITALLLESPCFSDNDSLEERAREFMKTAKMLQEFLVAKEKEYRRRVEEEVMKSREESSNP
jgi:hypothetical protein